VFVLLLCIWTSLYSLLSSGSLRWCDTPQNYVHKKAKSTTRGTQTTQVSNPEIKRIRVITKLANSEQSYKGKVKTQWRKEKIKKIINGRQNTAQKTEDWGTWTSPKNGVRLYYYKFVFVLLLCIWTSRITRSLVLYVCFVDRCLSFCQFSFGHCVVCSSSIYGLWLPLWYLVAIVLSVLPWLTAYDYPFGIL
jgi:hypothetical protein